MNVKDELLKELSTIHYANGMNIDTIKLNSDLGVKIIENVVKKLIIADVSQQRELLKAFQEYYQSDKIDDERTFDWNIDNFLKAFNCC